MRKLFIVAASVATLAVPSAAMADPPTGPVEGPGNKCFGHWRAATADGAIFAERKGENAELNAFAKEICESLVP
jgi:hypothetical protein